MGPFVATWTVTTARHPRARHGLQLADAPGAQGFLTWTSPPIGCGGPLRQYTGWGGLLNDYDNDGYVDLFMPTATRTISTWRNQSWPAGRQGQVH